MKDTLLNLYSVHSGGIHDSSLSTDGRQLVDQHSVVGRDDIGHSENTMMGADQEPVGTNRVPQ